MRLSLVLSSLLLAGLLALPAAAQNQDRSPDRDRGGAVIDPRTFDTLKPPKLGDQEDTIELGDGESPQAEPAEPEPELTREERMDKLFADLAEAENDEDAAFIAEEIEALWHDSGSPTVDLLTDRASDALEMEEPQLARELISGALELGPEHAEAWAESARIALAEDELGIALEHIEKAVELEPRHYYALTELGIILERLDQPAGAYAAYENALALNPRLPEARDGAERTERAAEGRGL